MSNRYKDIQDLNAEVVAISVDNLAGATQLVQRVRVDIPFPILYDPSREAPKSFMVFDLLDDGLATPSTFVVDRDGVIRWKYVGRSIGDRPSTSTILNELAKIEG